MVRERSKLEAAEGDLAEQGVGGRTDSRPWTTVRPSLKRSGWEIETPLMSTVEEDAEVTEMQWRGFRVWRLVEKGRRWRSVEERRKGTVWSGRRSGREQKEAEQEARAASEGAKMVVGVAATAGKGETIEREWAAARENSWNPRWERIWERRSGEVEEWVAATAVVRRKKVRRRRRAAAIGNW